MDDGLAYRLLSYPQFAALVGSSEAQIKQAVSSGRLLAIQQINPDGSRESGVAGFQALPEIKGAPLARILADLGYPGDGSAEATGAASAYQFFVACHDLLGNLTPIEVLVGTTPARGVQEGVDELLARSHAERVEFVAQVAKSTAAKWKSW